MRKIIAIILCCVLCFGLCVSVSAKEALIVLKADKNDDMITVSISADKAFSVASVELKYDETKVVFDSSSFSDELSAASVMINPDYSKNSVKLSVIAAENIFPEHICIIKFKVMKYASGTANFNIENAVMGDTEEYSLSYENIEIDISGRNSGNNGSIGGSNEESSPSSEQTTIEKEQTNGEILTPKWNNPFTDVNENDWFYESVKFVKDNHLMNGTSDTEFSPNANLTRAMLVTVLYRMEDSPECSVPTFNDVEANQWYSKGIAWALENNIVNGIGNNEFAPNNNITREQMATIIFRYATYKGIGTVTLEENLGEFSDNTSVSEYAVSALNWAIGKGIISGKGNGILDPLGNATRAETAAILQRFIEGNTK